MILHPAVMIRIRKEMIEIQLISLTARYKSTVKHRNADTRIAQESMMIRDQITALQKELTVCISSLND